MFDVIFIIICAGLIVKALAGESLPDVIFLSTKRQAPSAKKFPFICTQQKFGANVRESRRPVGPVARPSNERFCSVELNRAVSVSATLCQFLKKSVAESATLRQILRHQKSLKNQQRLSWFLTHPSQNLLQCGTFCDTPWSKNAPVESNRVIT